MNKTNLLLQMMEQPHRYTAKEWQEIVIDVAFALFDIGATLFSVQIRFHVVLGVLLEIGLFIFSVIILSYRFHLKHLLNCFLSKVSWCFPVDGQFLTKMSYNYTHMFN